MNIVSNAESGLKPPINGGCSCTAIRYEISAEPMFSIICQCSQCQKITDTGHAPAIAVASDSVRMTGKLKFYSLLADDGNQVSNGFCPGCGNPVLKKTSGYPDVLFSHVGSLDQAQGFRPEHLVYSESAQPWDNIDPKLVKP